MLILQSIEQLLILGPPYTESNGKNHILKLNIILKTIFYRLVRMKIKNLKNLKNY